MRIIKEDRISGVDSQTAAIKLMYYSQGFAAHDMGRKKKLPQRSLLC